jgi:hypothetical protein
MLHLGPDVLVFLNSVRLLRAKLSCPMIDNAASV